MNWLRKSGRRIIWSWIKNNKGIRAALHYYGGIDFARPGEKAPLKLVRVRSDYAPAKALTEAISRPHTDETFYLVAGTIR